MLSRMQGFCMLTAGASRAPQVVLGTCGRLKLEFFGIVRVITETLNPPYLQGKVRVGLRAGDGNRTRVLSLGRCATKRRAVARSLVVTGDRRLSAEVG